MNNTSNSNSLLNSIISKSENSQIARGDFVSDISEAVRPNNGYGMRKIVTILLLIVVLSLLGINVLGYTENVVEITISIIDNIFKYFGYSLVSLSKKTAEQSEKGVRFASSTIGETSKTILRNVDDILELPSSSTKNSAEIRYGYDDEEDISGRDDASSEIQQGSSSKSRPGYCYIGTDRGVRSCVKVGHYDKCMSGEVFPRMDMCINPKLRT